MLKKRILLSGHLVTLRGIDERDFKKVVLWRNDPENNRYLNQPFKLTLEKQKRWYYDKYMISNDLLFVFVLNETGEQIGTLGANDIDYDNRKAIAGRLLIGKKQFRGSPELLESNILFYDFLFEILGLKKVYCHIAEGNKKAMALDKRLGFHQNLDRIEYPQYCKVDNMNLIEMVNTKESYNESRQKLLPMLEHFILKKNK